MQSLGAPYNPSLGVNRTFGPTASSGWVSLTPTPELSGTLLVRSDEALSCRHRGRDSWRATSTQGRDRARSMQRRNQPIKLRCLVSPAIQWAETRRVAHRHDGNVPSRAAPTIRWSEVGRTNRRSRRRRRRARWSPRRGLPRSSPVLVDRHRSGCPVMGDRCDLLGVPRRASAQPRRSRRTHLVRHPQSRRLGHPREGVRSMDCRGERTQSGPRAGYHCGRRGAGTNASAPSWWVLAPMTQTVVSSYGPERADRFAAVTHFRQRPNDDGRSRRALPRRPGRRQAPSPSSRSSAPAGAYSSWHHWRARC